MFYTQIKTFETNHIKTVTTQKLYSTTTVLLRLHQGSLAPLHSLPLDGATFGRPHSFSGWRRKIERRSTCFLDLKNRLCWQQHTLCRFSHCCLWWNPSNTLVMPWKFRSSNYLLNNVQYLYRIVVVRFRITTWYFTTWNQPWMDLHSFHNFHESLFLLHLLPTLTITTLPIPHPHP